MQTRWSLDVEDYTSRYHALPEDVRDRAHAEATAGFPAADTFEESWERAGRRRRERALRTLKRHAGEKPAEWYRPATPGNPGNAGPLSYGAHSPAIVEPRAERFVEATRRSVPWLADATYQRALLGWARAEARCDLLAEYLEEHGLLDEEGKTRNAADLAAKFERQASEARGRLGLDPTSRVRLERDLAEAGLGQARLNDALSEGRHIRAVRDSAREEEAS